ncbi:MAG: trypsin-like peptidase domain-containing protein [bacterium]|nr:trypsin-like peptidase domain-containing protein [bacterium]
MRKWCRWVVAAVVVLTACQLGYAQISAGGTPPSEQWAVSANVPTVNMVYQDHQALLAEDETAGKDVPLRFAAEIPVNLNLNNSGMWETLPNGDRLWRVRIASANANTIGLVYDEWFIPKGGQLFIYNDDRSQVIGAFTTFNNWEDGTNITQPVKGSAVTLEYLEPAVTSGQSALSIMTVCHGYRDVFSRPRDRALDAFGSSGSCNNNINCPEGANWQDEKRGVAMILSGGSRICTGSLVNNTAADQTPYFLTAYHCLNGSQASWVFMFNYESASCSNVDGPTSQTVANATLRASWSTSDFALLQLSSAVPSTYNPYYNGWNRVNAASTNSICIHHPSGDIKKISFDNNAPTSSGWYTTGDNHWNIGAWDDGTTEPGSSGSPLFDQNSRITGQLHGGDATCTNNVNDYFGKFATSWAGGGTSATRLSNWLDPAGTAPNTLNGLNGTGGGGGTPPANDLCPGTAITSLPYSGSGSTTLATNNYTNCVGATSKEVIYSLTLTSCQNVTVSLCGSSYDTGLGVYSGGSCPGTTQVACNDDATTCGSGSTSSLVTFQAAANTTYWIRVHGYSTNSGNFTINVTGTACSGGGSNPDVCPGVAITAVPYSTTGNTTNAVNNYADCVGANSREHVYALTLSTCRVVTVSLCGSSYDTGLGIRTSGACPGTTLVACNDDFCGNSSQITFTANANQTYWLMVHGYSTRRGAYTLNVTGTACANPDGPNDGDGVIAVEMADPNKDYLPESYELHQNYPNPFNPSTSIAYDLLEASHVSLKVFDVLGREVATLATGHHEAGRYTVNFDAASLASGVYVYRLEANGFVDSKKMLLMK